MVQSRINPDIQYPELRTIDQEDIGHDADIYETNLLGNDHSITLGKIKYTYMSKGVVFFPIYLVMDDLVTDQIGVYELAANKAVQLELDGELDTDLLGDELLYSFAKPLLSNHGPDVAAPVAATDTSVAMASDDVLNTHIPEEEKAFVDEGIFRVEKNKHIPILPEESQQEADDIVRHFKPTPDQPWVQRFYKNNHYQIHEVESNGDCFFAVVRDAFQQLGRQTTVAALRKLVADNVSSQHYNYYRTIHDMMTLSIRQCDEQMTTLKHTLDKEMKPKLKRGALSAEAQRKLVEECREIERQYKTLQQERSEQVRQLDTILGANISTGLDNIETFQQHILKSTFWADDFTIAFLERTLHMKMIILSESTFRDKSLHHVLECGYGDTPLVPTHYIICVYDGSHYRLVSYKNKRIFTFLELPYHMKHMIIMKCMERNAGPFSTIPDFRTLKDNMGLEREPDINNNDQHSVVFMCYSRSDHSKRPGKGSGEKIPPERIASFQELHKIPYWRRKLDDSWINLKHPIEIDGHTYASVTHYMEGAKYKNRYPDIALQYALDSNSEVSKDLALCASYAPSHVEGEPAVLPDDDYPKRREEEYKKVLSAKFRPDEELHKILLLTQDAVLTHFVPRKPAEEMTSLMTLRSTLGP